MPPPTILQVLPALVSGGVERGTIEVSAALAASGWRPLVASAGGKLVPALEAAGARHVTLPLDRKLPHALLRNAHALTRLIRAEAVTLVHARSRAPAWSALWAARRAGVPFVTTWHGTYGEGLPGKRLWNGVMARGDRVIAVSRFIAERISVRHPDAAGRLRVIPRGVDPVVFDPASVAPARVAALRAAWAVPPDAPLILLPGRLSRWKGQDVLLRAMAAVPAPAVVVLAGGGSAALRARLAALAAPLGGRARLVGDVTDMPAALAAADVVVHASVRPEAFGRTVIEAQAMGRAVLAADLGGPRETVMHGKTGWLVPPGDQEALAAAIVRALADPAGSARVGAAARAAVLERYTTAAMTAATLDTYREML